MDIPNNFGLNDLGRLVLRVKGCFNHRSFNADVDAQ